MERADSGRTPGFKLLLACLVAAALSIPLFSIYLLSYDRQSQSREATESITAGWGGPQAMTGPVLVIPYRATATQTVVENGQSITRTNQVARELTLAPEVVRMSTDIRPDVPDAVRVLGIDSDRIDGRIGKCAVARAAGVGPRPAGSRGVGQLPDVRRSWPNWGSCAPNES